MKRDIEDYGNKLVISGLVLANAEETDIICFSEIGDKMKLVVLTPDELTAVFRQLDVLDITNNQKVVLRKSQRNMDQKVCWKVFKRDGYRCAYCGDDNTPLTFDHLVLWEDGGDTVEENGLSACKKCNHTRGSKSVPEFLQSNYIQSMIPNLNQMDRSIILGMYYTALELPLKPTKRSR